MKSKVLNIEVDYKTQTLGEVDKFDSKMDMFIVSINGERFEYFQGIGHRTEKRNRGGITPIIKRPELDDVLYCLVMDSDAEDCNFNEWADNIGYDSDSLKALNIYKECLENTAKLRRAGIDLIEARELFCDY